MKDSMKFVSLFANWRSGATLLTILLNNHSKIVSHGESFPFSVDDKVDYECSCGESFRQCRHFRDCGAHMFDTTTDTWDTELFVRVGRYSNIPAINTWFQSYNYCPRVRDFALASMPAFKRKNQEFLESHKLFFKNSLLYNKTEVYLDGTKSIRRAEIFVKEELVSPKILHLVRDGSGYCGSNKKSTPKGRYKDKSHVIKFAKDWVAYEAMVNTFSKRYPNVPVMTVRYEDLCRDLVGTMKKVAVFMDVDFEDSMLGKDVGEYHLLGNQMKRAFKGEIKEDLSWQAILFSEEKKTVTKIMKKTLSLYGYL